MASDKFSASDSCFSVSYFILILTLQTDQLTRHKAVPVTVFENHIRAWRCFLFSLGPLLVPWWCAVIEITQQPCSVGSVNMLLSSTAISRVTKHLRPLLQEEPCSEDLNNIRFYNQLCLYEVARINNLCLKSQQLKSSLSGSFIWPCPTISAWSFSSVVSVILT